MSTIFLGFLLIFATGTQAALPVLTRPIMVPRPVVVKPEFARLRFQNIATRFNNGRDVANYFGNDQIEGNFDPSQLTPPQRKLFNQLVADTSAHGENFNEDILKVFIQSLAGSEVNIDTLIQWVMTKIAKDSNADLKAMIDKMQNTTKKKKELRDAMKSLKLKIDLCALGNCGGSTRDQLNMEMEKIKGQLDSSTQIGEQQSLRLQMYMDRTSKAVGTLSNILKKFSETSSQIIGNLK